MKRTLSFILTLVLLIGLMPMQAFATKATGNADDAEILRQLARETSFPLGNISGNIAVLGDSTISGYPKYSALSTYFSVADGYTITDISKAGDTIVGQLNKWKALSVTEKSALNYVFVQIGLNDTDETAETFRAQYTSLIEQIRADAPDAMLILGTMVPCKQRWKVLYPNTWEEHQERWEIANEDIQNGYYDCDSVAYLHTEALGLDGNLRKEYNHGDHIHENAEGAKVIAYSWYLAAFGHSHRYSSIVTSPTCTEPGYTTYTCECGDSYVADYVDATGHTYENCICTGCGAVQPAPEWEVGTIAYVNGLDRDSTTRLRTADHLKLSDYAAVRIGNGYELVRFVYDENHTMLSGTDWLGSGVGFSVEELLSQYPNGMYFRIAVRATNDRTLTINDLAASGITFYTSSEDVPEQEIGWNQKEVMKVTVNQDGAVYSGKVFCFNGSGTCTVYSLDDKSSLGSFTLDNISALNPHANSVCFSNTFHAPGDQYPLLYVNVYNNYSSAADRMEGTCCVYRLTEDDGQFTTELVQVVRIGFTEDLSLWKSKENNGDVRPYGNFVVDTDKDELYAFVMRDAENSTRFFRFRLPDLDAGVYSAAYGCNVVTLEIGDILSWFDTNYMTYMQGCCYGDGKILSVEGFSSGTLRIIDLETQREVRTEYLADRGLTCEPELICLDNGTLYYAGTDGTLRVLSLDGMHFHNYTAATTAPTCTEHGYTAHTCHCGDTYIDTYVVPLGHNPSAVVVENRVEPTCTTSGSYDNVVYCTKCREELSREKIIVDALGHSYGNWYEVTAPSCIADGLERHDCTRCDTFETNVITKAGHTKSAVTLENNVTPTCTMNGSYDNVVYCANCGIELSRCEVIVDALGHTYESWHQIIAPSCEDHGVEYRGCNNCDYYETRTISATGHDWIEKDGYKICGSCNETVDIETPSIDFEKNHSECEGSIFETIINMIINFLRNLLGLPEVCVCGEELY